jgi:hypothetical protein
MSTSAWSPGRGIAPPSRRWATWKLCVLASLFAAACTGLLDAIVFLHWPFALESAPPRLPDGATPMLLGAIAVQPLALMIRVALVALTVQGLLLAAGSVLRFRIAFRAATIASFVSLAGLVVALWPVWRDRDLASVAQAPGSLALLVHARSPLWSAAIGQLSLFDVAWCAVLYRCLAMESGLPGKRVLLATLATWMLAFLLGLVLRLLPLYLGLAPA